MQQEETLELLEGTSLADGLKERVKAATLRLERELIDRALRETHGNVTHAARLLKISRKGLQLKMKELGLRERDERDAM
jgi:DNA-binding NtrC family response regulator